jgi:serine/threonine-protein kinase
MAPELLSGDSTATRSDIWALGVLPFETVSGTLPFAGTSLYGLMHDIIGREPEVPETVPGPLGLVIQRCLHKNPEIRYQTGREVRAALEEGAFV